MIERSLQARNVATAVGLIAAVLLGCIAARALWRADDLQDRYNRGYALQVASAELLPLLDTGDADALNARVRTLVRDPALGLSFLSVRDPLDAILATEGRYERLGLRWLSNDTRQRVRTWLYRSTSDYGRVDLVTTGRRVGSVEYAFAPDLARDIREQAIGDLRVAGWTGLLLALPTALALGLVLLRQHRAGADVSPRLVQGRAEDAGPLEDAPPEFPRGLRDTAGQTLDGLGRAVITVDRAARIRYLNQSASVFTGWSLEEARGRLVYSVFHPLDERQAPLVTPAETCLRENREYPSTEIMLRARGGAIHYVEVLAVPLHDEAEDAPSGAAMVFHDVGERRERIEALQRSVRLSLGVIDHLVEGVLTTTKAGVVRFANARALRMFGYGREELEGLSITRLLPAPFLNTPGVQLSDYIGARAQTRLPKVVGWRKDATTFPVELVVQPLNVDEAEGLVVILRDITERLRTDNLSQRLGRLLDAAAEEVYIFDAQSLYFVEVNRGARRNLGYAAAEIPRLSLLAISQELESEAFHGHLARLRGGEVEHITYRCRHLRADDSSYPVEVRLNFSRDEEPPMFMAIAVDISEREAHEDLLRHQAQHDALTGLPNRATLMDRLRQVVLNAGRSNRLVGVYFLDLDRFKQINDAHGHEAGDAVLKAVAQRLLAVLRESDTVARLGGDEFVVVAQGLRGLEDAESLARKLLEAFEPRFEAILESGELALRVTPSIGLALYPLDDADAESLLRHADAAMYQAKQSGAGQYRIYSVEVAPDKRRRLELERGLSTALALQQLDVQLTPACALDGVALGAQTLGALLLGFSWPHARQGRIDGAELLAAAGRAGVLADVELWSLFRACALALPDAQDADAPPLPVIVNLSGWQLRDAEFSAQVFELMERHQVPPRRLILALSAAGLREAREAPAHLTRRLRDRGLRFALRGSAADVFAALDGATRAMLPELVILEEAGAAAQNAQAAERLRLALLGAKGLGLPVLALGVDDAATRDGLAAQGCRYAAGEAMGTPLTIAGPGDFLGDFPGRRPIAPL